MQIDVRQNRRNNRTLRSAPKVIPPFAPFHDASIEPLDNQADNPPVADTVLQKPDQPVPVDSVKVRPDVRIDNPSDPSPFYPESQGVERIMRPTSGSEPIAESEELRLVYRQKDGLRHRLLGPILSSTAAMPSGRVPPSRLRYLYPPRRTRPVRSALNPVMQVAQPFGQTLPVFMPRHAIHACRCLLLQRKVGRIERFRRDVVQQRSELLLRLPRCCLPYPLRRLCHARPALCPVRALASRIPLGSSPSLRRLRRKPRSLCSPPSSVLWPDPIAPTRSSSIRTISSLPRPRYDDRGRIGALSGPLRGRTCVPGFLDAAEPTRPHESGRSVLPSAADTASALRMTVFRRSIALPARAATDTSHDTSRCPAHGSRRRRLVTPFLPPDFHRLSTSELA